MSSRSIGHVLSLALLEEDRPCIFYTVIGLVGVDQPADSDGSCLGTICEAMNFARARSGNAQVLINCTAETMPSLKSRISWLKQTLHELCEAFADEQGQFTFSEFKPIGGDEAPQIAFSITWTRKQPA